MEEPPCTCFQCGARVIEAKLQAHTLCVDGTERSFCSASCAHTFQKGVVDAPYGRVRNIRAKRNTVVDLNHERTKRTGIARGRTPPHTPT